MYCTKCGIEVKPESTYCGSCGNFLGGKADNIIPSPCRDENLEIQSRQSDKTDNSKVHVDQSKTFLGGACHPWRRFFARTVDLLCSGVIFLMLALILIATISQHTLNLFISWLENPLLAGIILYIFWLPIEAIFLSTTGTTPAKFIFGIRVLDAEGKKMSFADAFKRTISVWVRGDGFGIPIVSLVTRLISYRYLTETGTTKWDSTAKSVVLHKKWGVLRACFSTLAVFSVMFMISVLNSLGTK